MVREQECQWSLTQKQTLLGGGALKRGHGAPFERLAQLGDALGGVGAIAITIDAAELVVTQTAMGKQACQWALTLTLTLTRALTQKQTLSSWFERR
jgi:hypothetical protein